MCLHLRFHFVRAVRQGDSSRIHPCLVVVWDVKEFFAADFKRKLHKNSTGSEAHAMLLNIMAKGPSKDLESLEAMIDSFALVSDLVA